MRQTTFCLHFGSFLKTNMNKIRQRKGFETRAYTLDPESDFIEDEYTNEHDRKTELAQLQPDFILKKLI